MEGTISELERSRMYKIKALERRKKMPQQIDEAIARVNKEIDEQNQEISRGYLGSKEHPRG